MSCLVLSCQFLFEGWILGEVVFDDMLSQPRDDENRFDAGLKELLNGVVDERSVEDGQHFFRNGFRRRQHTRTKPRGGNDSFTDRTHARRGERSEGSEGCEKLSPQKVIP